jgi:hypothetical protein
MQHGVDDMPEKIKFSCPLCKEEFYNTTFHEKFAADSCKCGNLIITLRYFSTPMHCKYYLAIGFIKEKPIWDFKPE